MKMNSAKNARLILACLFLCLCFVQYIFFKSTTAGDCPLPNRLDGEEEKMVHVIRKLLLDNTKTTEPVVMREQGKVRPMKGGRGQPLVIDHLLGNRRNGFFIEAGAANGQQESNSFFFEHWRNWTGLLVEANPVSYRTAVKTNRKATFINCCLATNYSHQVVEFETANVFGGIVGKAVPSVAYGYPNDPSEVKTIKADCYPLSLILTALGRTKVDFLALDVQGAELPILRTIPFNKFEFGIVMVEADEIGKIFDGDIRDLFQLLNGAGFDFLGTVYRDVVFGNRKWTFQDHEGRERTSHKTINLDVILEVYGYLSIHKPDYDQWRSEVYEAASQFQRLQ